MPTAELHAPLSRTTEATASTWTSAFGHPYATPKSRPRPGEEVTEVPGVSAVVVDLAANAVTVNGTYLDDERLRAAIVEAGYGIADSTAA
ncbi:heavy-metal-associated domain-containing protein [Streptomyces sp. NPDC040750]|uniref:heavy-metal-associated domain-containing protein n=1 Tax=Streptomyces sp. NPDC040750 TaxID=3154491 RepID=UPI0034092C03